MKMTAAKGVAGGIAANVVVIALWGLSTIPGWASVPDAPKAAIVALVTWGIGYGIVFLGPPNRQVAD